MTKLGGRCIVRKSRWVRIWRSQPPGSAPHKMWRWATTLGKSGQAVYYIVY